MDAAAVVRRGLRPTTSDRLVRVVLTALVPLLLLALIVERGTSLPIRAAEGVVTIALLVVIAKRPGPALAVLVVFLPLQLALLALLYRIGVPGPVVRALGGLKELIVVGMSFAAIGAFRRDGRRVDALDLLALAYLLLLVAYLLAPFALTLPTDLPFSVRLLALRTDGLFVLAFLAARHADITARSRRAVVVAVVTVAAVMGATALFENVDSHAWNTFLVTTLRVPQYKLAILGIQGSQTDALFHGFVGSRATIRVGGILLSPLTLGFALLLPLALALARLSSRRPTWTYGLGAVLSTAAILVTLTRSAILAFLVTVLMVLRGGFARLTPGRLRLLFIVLAAAALAAPLASSSAPVERLSATFSGHDTSTSEHENSLQIGLDVIRSNPLGLGLGTDPAIGARFAVADKVTSENSYLQVANEIGVETMVVFIALFVLLLLRVSRRARDGGEGGDLATAVLAAGFGLALAGFFLHIWQDFTTAVTFWAIAGMCLGPRRDAADRTAPAAATDRQEQVPEQPALVGGGAQPSARSTSHAVSNRNAPYAGSTRSPRTSSATARIASTTGVPRSTTNAT